MPTYQYACKTCGHELEAVQSFSDEPLTACPECAGQLRKVFSAVGVVFKGSGFYRTDSRVGKGLNGSSESNGSKGTESSGSASSKDTTGSTGSTGSSGPGGSGGSGGSGSSGSKDSPKASAATGT